MQQTTTAHGSGAQDATVETHRLADAGSFPNNPRLAVLIYRGAFGPSESPDELASSIERVFARHGWSAGWRDAIYDYHHYHSNVHEVLGCYRGHARAQLGGAEGPVIELWTGDVLVLPAGTAHKSLAASDDFSVVGAYAQGRAYDMLCGEAGERPSADQRIAQVPMPDADPVHGRYGPLLQHWSRAPGES